MTGAAGFYVYEHWRPDTGLPFYVGKGINGLAEDLNGRRPHHKRISAKLRRSGLSVEIRKVFTHVDEITAFALERSQISYWRSRGIRLINITDGGEGTWGRKASATERLARVKIFAAPAIREKISEGTKRAFANPEVKARHLKNTRLASANPSYRAGQSMRSRAFHADPESKAMHSASTKAALARPETKARKSATQKAVQARPGSKEQRSAAMKALFARPEMRAKISAGTKAALARPDVKARHIAASKATLANPEVRAKISSAVKAAWVRRKSLTNNT